jgi:hypothetical protein
MYQTHLASDLNNSMGGKNYVALDFNWSIFLYVLYMKYCIFTQ